MLGLTDPCAGNRKFDFSQDTRNALVATMIPGGAAVAAFALFAKDKEVVDCAIFMYTDLPRSYVLIYCLQIQKVKKPQWAPTDVRLYSIMDVLTIAPLGYASYLVYKNGGGFDYTDTRLALGVYGANMILALTTIPLVKKKNLSCVSRLRYSFYLSSSFFWQRYVYDCGIKRSAFPPSKLWSYFRSVAELYPAITIDHY
ncbi:unnamed protein product [Heligmosomoides polygyrus]|uniref:Serpentine receptor class gamma n=1 Tax=Heligmosomoides polygyrus TaxID=6339 RepID=A0A183F8A6_HELPZ|nr:unnamed protein product [Heligmosomoides polygyrus]